MLKQSLILATSAAFMAFAAPVLAQDAPTRDTVVASVNGTDITLGQMIVAASQLPQQYQQLPPDVLFQGVMDQIIQQTLLANTLESEPGRVTIALANERRSLMAGEVINTLAEAAVTEEAVQAAYDATYATATPAKEYHAAHILVATEEEALAVKARLDAGEDFATVAQELSIDTGSGAAGGDLGWFGLGMMVPEFEQAVVAAEVGALAGPVQTQFGFHLISLLETRDQAAPALEDVRADIEGQLRQSAIEAKLAELTEGAEITLPAADAFDPTIISNLDLLLD